MEHKIEMADRRLLFAVLTLFVVLGTTYSVVVPPFEASDELWHYPMVKTIADNWSLPVQDPANVGPWRQEGSQPPLYYVVNALATCWIDTSDMSRVRHLNPHVDNGIATPDGNVNLVVHRPGRESLPWQGTVLAVHVARFLSVAMAACGVALTYFVVREALPGQPALALGATAIHAFTPMVVFIAGSVNNDNLVVPLSSLALLMMLRLLRPLEKDSDTTDHRRVPRYLLLGLILGLAALTKASSLALTLLTALVVTIRAARRGASSPRRGWREFVTGGLATLLPLMAVAGWWYLRNLRLYGDPSGLNAFIEILGRREVPAGIAQLWRERQSFLAGYWGNFGGLNVPMSPWVYQILNGILVMAGLGLVMTLARNARRTAGARSRDPEPDPWRARPDTAFASRSASDVAARRLKLVVCLLWGLGVLIPWIRWARVTWSSQGRLLFAALPVWSLLLAMGLSAWVPRGFAFGPRVHIPALVIPFVLFLLALSAAAPFVWIQPAYALPDPLTDGQMRSISRPTNISFDGTMRLLGYDVGMEKTWPGGQVVVTLYWEALAPTEDDHTVFVHLLDDYELLVAQRDTFPGLGLLSTTWLDPGQRWADRYVIAVPPTAYAPNEAQIEMGLFNTRSGERLTVFDTSQDPIISEEGPDQDNVRFGEVGIRPRPSPKQMTSRVPNPLSVTFGGRMLLTGYDLGRRRVPRGETVTLTLHWAALRTMEQNYTVSAQLIDPAQRKAAQHDSWPLSGAAPTTSWQPGNPVTDTVPLTVFADVPPGSYGVRVAVYVHQNGAIQHLPVIPPDGTMQTNHVTLTQVRVTP